NAPPRMNRTFVVSMGMLSGTRRLWVLSDTNFYESGWAFPILDFRRGSASPERIDLRSPGGPHHAGQAQSAGTRGTRALETQSAVPHRDRQGPRRHRGGGPIPPPPRRGAGRG